MSLSFFFKSQNESCRSQANFSESLSVYICGNISNINKCARVTQAKPLKTRDLPFNKFTWESKKVIQHYYLKIDSYFASQVSEHKQQ